MTRRIYLILFGWTLELQGALVRHIPVFILDSLERAASGSIFCCQFSWSALFRRVFNGYNPLKTSLGVSTMVVVTYQELRTESELSVVNYPCSP
jgi:hypothetical protein